MEVIRVNNQWGTYSWTTGFKPAYHKSGLEQEAKRVPQAVIFRLLNEGEDELAEYFFEKYVVNRA